jgi:preprotein translocase subunit SecG
MLHLLLMPMHLLLLLMMKVLLLLHHLCGGDLLRLRGGGNWILKRAIPD